MKISLCKRAKEIIPMTFQKLVCTIWQTKNNSVFKRLPIKYIQRNGTFVLWNYERRPKRGCWSLKEKVSNWPKENESSDWRLCIWDSASCIIIHFLISSFYFFSEKFFIQTTASNFSQGEWKFRVFNSLFLHFNELFFTSNSKKTIFMLWEL